MIGKHARSYIALCLIVAVISTAWTATAWIWRDRAVRLLALQGPDCMFAASQGQEILSISVTPERELESLELRFRCLIERDPLTVGMNTSMFDSVQELLDACPPVADRLAYFSEVGAEPFISIHDVHAENVEGGRVIFVDFGKVYSSLFDPIYDNESVTTFAFLVNSTDHIAGYFEGYSDFLVARVEKRLLRREQLLELVCIESGDETEEYLPEPGANQLSIQDLPAWGQISFTDTLKDKPYGVTLVVKEGMIQTGRLMVTVETFAEGRWFEEASGYWIVRTGLR